MTPYIANNFTSLNACISVIVILLQIERQRKIWYNVAADRKRNIKFKGFFDEINNIDSDRLGTEEISPLLLEKYKRDDPSHYFVKFYGRYRVPSQKNSKAYQKDYADCRMRNATNHASSEKDDDKAVKEGKDSK